jgi:hypothetical protein
LDLGEEVRGPWVREPRSLVLHSFFHYRGFYHGDWVGESKTFLKCMQRMQYLKIGFKCMILKRKW